MTSTERDNTIAKLKNDNYFAVSFAVDNNPNAFIEKLRSMGYALNSDQKNNILESKKIIFGLVGDRKTNEVKNIFDSINYLDNDTSSAEYTKGYRAYFIENTPPALVTNDNYSAKSGFSFDGLLAGIGAGLVTYSSISSFNSTTGLMTPSQSAAAQAEAEAARKKKVIWGIVIGSIVVIGIVTIAIIYFGKDKKAKS